MLYSRPDLMHRMLAINADAVAAYLNAQIDAGAQAVMIFDSWGGVLADGAFQEFSLAYTARVLAQLKRDGADGAADAAHRVHQGRRPVAGGDARARLRGAGPRLDGEPRPARARWSAKARGKALQGNIDPNVLFAPPGADRGRSGQGAATASARRTRDPDAAGPTHIFNLGHGISQYTPPEHVAALVDAVHAHSRAHAR